MNISSSFNTPMVPAAPLAAFRPNAGSTALPEAVSGDASQLSSEELEPSELIALFTAALMQNFGGLAAGDAADCCCAPSQETASPAPQASPVGPPQRNASQSPPPQAVPKSSPATPAQKTSDSAPNPEGYAFPVQGYQGEVALHHGSNRGGSDIFAPRGTPVMSMRGGTVTSAGNSEVGGNNVMVEGDDGLSYYYAHMDQAPLVSPGDKIAAGQQLGVVGDSGNAKGTGTHLHIGIGPEIVNGVGPAGGTGGDFDAVGLLNRTLQG